MNQHASNEAWWWASQDIDPIIIAALLYAHSGDEEAGRLVIEHARRLARWTGKGDRA
jgi:hypothetical protein